jgi:hypothetical protein
MGSKIQNDIADWIESTMGLDVGRNVSGIIGRLELDVYIPQHAVAIEVNGLYWHNETAGKGQTYHQTKTNACKTLNIQLLHVFEDEWYHKQDIVKSIVAFKLGEVKRRIHARECSVIELEPKQKREFFNANHLDGDALSTKAWGLKLDDEIVYALAVRRPKHRKYDGALEVARCCPKTFTNVPGGIGKLVAVAAQYAVENGYKKLLTYVDTRLGGDGKGYVMAGFTQTDTTPPRFWWTDGHARFDRFKFRASEGKSQQEVAEAAGVTRIWGCSNFVYEMQLVRNQ